jgi:hypothetical protein
MRGDGCRKVREGAYRGTQHYAIGTGDGAAWIALDPIREAKFPDAVEGFPRPRGNDHLRRQITALLGDARDGAADQADADQRQPLEQGPLGQGFRHASRT